MARILVADDETDIRNLVAFTLRRRGHEIIEAKDGAEALRLIRRVPPDLAVLDVMMPGLSGLEVARVLAADPATAATRVLLLSTLGQASEIAAGLETGAHAYLVKPFTPADLAARVAELLAQATTAAG
jgi:two-component system phosphate regulon response regulator PhoB